MADSAGIAQKLWDCWLPYGAKKLIGTSLRRTALFLSATHDIGKATPLFQAGKSVYSELDIQISEQIRRAGLPMEPASYFKHPAKTPHALATHLLLKSAGYHKSIAAILGAHHGKPSDSAALNDRGISVYPENFHLGKAGEEAWGAVQRELLDFALDLAGLSSAKDLPQPDMTAQVLLSGLVIMADWIASNETLFPYIHLGDQIVPCEQSRIESAWGELELPYPWETGNLWMGVDFFGKRFSHGSPNTVQSVVTETASAIQSPGILVLEAPMGVGKTEAALVAAEIFASKAKRKGIFFALPTQATADGIFPRISEWVGKLGNDFNDLRSMRLMHGKAQFNETYQKLLDGANIDADGGIAPHEWFEGFKKGMLDDFVVGTIDQLLLAALKQKHLMMRHLGLANKVVIIDECHAYDAYMSQYLYMALSWLGAYRVPVIVLSATLPAGKRKEVIHAYFNADPGTNSLDIDKCAQERPAEWVTCDKYPLITFTDGREVNQVPLPADDIPREVQISFLPENEFLSKLDDLLSGGGCAGIIVNTVARAQELAKVLCSHFGEETVRLLHSRFLAPDRAAKEKKLLAEMGKSNGKTERPDKCVVIGTQVLEQSLDIDFDVLVTDICPMDLLLQRIGRLHRHKRSRPEKLRTAICLVTGVEGNTFQSGAQRIYGNYLLMRTKARLPQRIHLPQDISGLVQDVYGDIFHPNPEPPGYQEAAAGHQVLLERKKERAEKFRISPPWRDGTLINWLNTNVSEKSGEAAVRDTDESIEVLVIQKKLNGKLFFPEWIEDGRELAQNEVPNNDLARALARCSVRLPAVLCAPWVIDETIKALESINMELLPTWQKSPWLSGELFLVLDEHCSARLGGYKLVYDQYFGLRCDREEKTDA